MRVGPFPLHRLNPPVRPFFLSADPQPAGLSSCSLSSRTKITTDKKTPLCPNHAHVHLPDSRPLIVLD